MMCTTNLKQILFACQLYGKDNADVFPPSVGVLFPGYIPDSDIYVCPTAAERGHVPNTNHEAFVPDAVCYCYVAGMRATDAEDLVLAFDEEWNHRREGIVVARIGGRVEWVRDIKAFHLALEKQRTALAAEGREMHIIRPTWSRWPDPPDYPVRPWHERGWAIAPAMVAAILLAAGVFFLRLRARRSA
ncbi:MAG: hypothetical protein ACYTKD_08570 [Planctomycetota bacterium]|jgi:hypothetical protein